MHITRIIGPGVYQRPHNMPRLTTKFIIFYFPLSFVVVPGHLCIFIWFIPKNPWKPIYKEQWTWEMRFRCCVIIFLLLFGVQLDRVINPILRVHAQLSLCHPWLNLFRADNNGHPFRAVEINSRQIFAFVRINPEWFYSQFPGHTSAQAHDRNKLYFSFVFSLHELDFKCLPQPDALITYIYGLENYIRIAIECRWRWPGKTMLPLLLAAVNCIYLFIIFIIDDRYRVIVVVVIDRTRWEATGGEMRLAAAAAAAVSKYCKQLLFDTSRRGRVRSYN